MREKGRIRCRLRFSWNIWWLNFSWFIRMINNCLKIVTNRIWRIRRISHQVNQIQISANPMMASKNSWGQRTHFVGLRSRSNLVLCSLFQYFFLLDRQWWLECIWMRNLRTCFQTKTTSEFHGQKSACKRVIWLFILCHSASSPPSSLAMLSNCLGGNLPYQLAIYWRGSSSSWFHIRSHIFGSWR